MNESHQQILIQVIGIFFLSKKGKKLLFIFIESTFNFYLKEFKLILSLC